MSETASKDVVERLGIASIVYPNICDEAIKEIERLREQVAEHRQSNDEQFRIWLEEKRDLANEVEDLRAVVKGQAAVTEKLLEANERLQATNADLNLRLEMTTSCLASANDLIEKDTQRIKES